MQALPLVQTPQEETGKRKRGEAQELWEGGVDFLEGKGGVNPKVNLLPTQEARKSRDYPRRSKKTLMGEGKETQVH